MSAYGTIAVSGPVDFLPPTGWDLPPPPPGKPFAPFLRLVLHHLRLDSTRAHPGLIEYTHNVFAAEVEAGRTYPQEADVHDDRPYTRAAFEAYFWAADVFVAVGIDDAADSDIAGNGGGDSGHDRKSADVDVDVEASRRGRSWEDVLVGFYYVKPNYPGRSSHVSVFLSGMRSMRSFVGGCADGERKIIDLQCRLCDPPSSQAVRVWHDPGQVVLTLRSLAWVQSERF